MEVTILGIAIFVCVFIAIFALLPATKKKPEKVSMNCEMCIRSIGDDTYHIEARWCDTSAKVTGKVHGDMNDITLYELVKACQGLRENKESNNQEEFIDRDG